MFNFNSCLKLYMLVYNSTFMTDTYLMLDVS